MNQIRKNWTIILIAFTFFMFIKPALCFFIVGSLAFYMGTIAIRFLKKIQDKGVECTGKILSFQSDDEGYKTPVLEFTTSEGELINEKPFAYASTDISKVRSYKNMIDKQVSILYDPDDPKKFVLTDEKGFSYFAFSFFILVGLGFIILSICGLLGYIKIGW